jgi:hypothetical protein
MIFTLEALRAKHGDSLLLHYGKKSDPQLMVIDGGPSGVFNQNLKPRLAELKAERSGDDPLPIRLLMVSHIDDDHIRGVLDLTKGLVRQMESEESLDWEIAALWHNSFDDLVGEGAEKMVEEASVGLSLADLEGGALLPADGVSRPSALVLASVAQGRNLRLDAKKLALELNPPDGRLLTGAETGDPPLEFEGGLSFRVVGPNRQRIAELQKKWAEELERRKRSEAAKVEAAAYVDESVFNLSSIAVLAEAGGKTMLLTGDARGDDLLGGLEKAGLLKKDKLHVDVLKMPHHGSDRNVETDFFRRVTADHYVFSGDGRHGNPEVATFAMIFAAREKKKPFTFHLTYGPEDLIEGYPKDELTELFASQKKKGVPFEVVSPEAGEKGLSIHLGEAL